MANCIVDKVVKKRETANEYVFEKPDVNLKRGFAN